MWVKSAIRILFAWGLLALLVGCVSNPPQRDPAFAAARPVALPQPKPDPNGAIYQAGYEIRLFEDRKARRVGDTLTIQLVENTNAITESETETNRDTNIGLNNPTLFGAPVQFNAPGWLPLATHKDNDLSASVGGVHEFEGDGSSTQKNALSGTITVTVAEVLPNGNLVVQGEKLLYLNQGREHIRIAGVVRPDDVDTDNTV